MELKKRKIINLVVYLICTIIYTIGIVILYKLLFKLHYYYLFVTIPILFIFITLCLSNILKALFTSISMLFLKGDNNEVERFVIKATDFINRLCKYILIGIFTSLLTSTMILDIILCVNKEKFDLVALSIVIWILLYYILFKNIVKMIKREIKI